jgi:uncharacterized protein YndB with AHSA1/START domain
MELKTKVSAEEGKQDLTITREFDLPLELLFKAYEDAAMMGTNVLKYESKKHGGYLFETKDAKGNVAFNASGVFHEFSTNKKITKTFEMEGAPFGVQLEVYEFEPVTEDTSKLTMHVIYESGAQRDQLLKLPFAQGLNYAHNRLQEIMNKLK